LWNEKTLGVHSRSPHTGWLKKSKLLTQYNSLLFLSHPVYATSDGAPYFNYLAPFPR